ncbi:hypothetical protein LTR56_024720 [Elasticomyces elasticus]|nr:hypothetical protein LTR56_024720 [Elasticomyces elasticus]KAK3619168.1 hypothetical protein LTR22_026080 [Elasticomyces elasticus]KAK4903827.1 hypothetical protein LTR49_026607 [Elasticomyces elasticus]
MPSSGSQEVPRSIQEGADNASNRDSLSPRSPGGEESRPSPTSAREPNVLLVAKKTRRLPMTRHACIRCRELKAKCNGKRPICARCAASYNRCVYDVVDEGVTRLQHVQQKLHSKTFELDRMAAVLQSLRGSNDNEAAETVAALRRGDSLESIMAALPQHPIYPPEDVADSSFSRSLRSTYTADAVTSSWSISPALSRTEPYVYGLEASMSESAFAAYFGVNQVCDRLSAQQQHAAQRRGDLGTVKLTPHDASQRNDHHASYT